MVLYFISVVPVMVFLSILEIQGYIYSKDDHHSVLASKTWYEPSVASSVSFLQYHQQGILINHCVSGLIFIISCNAALWSNCGSLPAVAGTLAARKAGSIGILDWFPDCIKDE
jgi:hypothetical protein